MSLALSSASVQVRELYQKALEARAHSYSPYSHFQVGAAIRTSRGAIFTGCNVENASYGATLCAERSAIVRAVSEAGPLQIEEVMVVTDATPPWPPCGLCRQMICEFISPSDASKVPIHTANLAGELITFKWSDLFPEAFTLNALAAH